MVNEHDIPYTHFKTQSIGCDIQSANHRNGLDLVSAKLSSMSHLDIPNYQYCKSKIPHDGTPPALA